MEYRRLVYYGEPGTYREFLRMPLTDRYLANDALDQIIEIVDSKGTNRPRDER